MMTTAEFGLATIGQIAVTVHDVERATAFYRDVLRVPFLFSAPPGLAFFRCGSTWLMLSLPEPEFDHPSSVLYFDVPDIAAAHAALSGRGVRFRDAPHPIHRDASGRELWLAFFRDTEGNTHALRSWKDTA
jgi:methylmalonyl-CoA/ethylmalonyl-CoA epimerase